VTRGSGSSSNREQKVRFYTIAATLALLLVHAAGSAAPPALMAPTGPWNVEFADSMCLLSRSYEKDRTTTLIIKPSMIGTDLEIVVMKARTAIGNVRGGRVVLSVANGAPVDDVYFTAYSTAKMRLVRINARDKVALANLRGTLSIDAERKAVICSPYRGSSARFRSCRGAFDNYAQPIRSAKPKWLLSLLHLKATYSVSLPQTIIQVSP